MDTYVSQVSPDPAPRWTLLLVHLNVRQALTLDPEILEKPMQRIHRIVVVALVAATSQLAHGIDEPGTTAVQWAVEEGGNGHWYEYNWDQTTDEGGVCWSDARNRCLEKGGDLVAVSSPEESDFISVMICPMASEANGNLGWLGLMPDGNGGAMWSNGEVYDWTFWGTGQPSGDGPYAAFGCTEQGSGYIHMSWNDIGGSGGCHTSGPGGLPLAFWITEWSADCNGDGIVDYGQILDGTYEDKNGNGVPDCCDEGEPCDGGESPAVQWKVEDGGNGHWYELNSVEVTWVDAQSNAESQGGHLVTLTTEQEFTFVYALSGHGKWIGAYQPQGSTEPAGGWQWVTGESWGGWAQGIADQHFDDCDGGYSAPTCAEGCDPDGQQNLAITWSYGPRIDDENEFGCPESGSISITKPYINEWSADCNGDGLVDYGQILDGTYEDKNGNGVLDICEDGPEITVDDDLLDYPNADFTSIQAAIDAAQEGDVVLVYPGRYTSDDVGAVVTIDGKQITLVSVGGAGVTFVDGEGSRIGLYCHGFLDADTLVQGFTFENCLQSDEFPAVVWFHRDSGPTMADCVIRNSTGVAIGSFPDYPSAPSGNPRIIRCEVSNCVNTNTGNHYWLVTCAYNSPLYEDCRFVNNQAPIIAFNYWYSCAPTFRGCLFEGNTTWNGGVVHARSGANVTMEDCQFRDNVMQEGCVLGSSNDGGGIGIFNLSGTEFCGNEPGNGICGTWNDLGGNTFEDQCSCNADVYPDGVIDSIDLLVLLAYYGLDDPGPADVDGDGDADANDILAVIAAWGVCE